MVTTRKNTAPMPATTRTIDGLEELYELNRLFLISLIRDLRAGLNRFGLPASAARVMRRAPEALLERLAEFPQSLFELDLAHLGSNTVKDPSPVTKDPVERTLNLTLLVSAWNMSRRNDYWARLFLRLTAAEILALRTTPLSELARLSAREALVGCAFREPDWLWHELVTEGRPEYRRRLLLLGLQPRVEINPTLERAIALRATV